jgi:hypothetical protein
MKRTFLICILSLSGIVMAESTKIVHLPDGNTVENKVSTIDPIPQKIRLLTSEEIQNIASASRQSQLFVNYYLPDINNPDLKDYDNAFRAWQTSKNKKYSSQQVVELIGSYLGEKCVKELDMEWVEITDEYGTDRAVRGKRVEITSFPFSVVSKRIEKNEYEFIYSVFHTIEQMRKDGAYKNR